MQGYRKPDLTFVVSILEAPASRVAINSNAHARLFARSIRMFRERVDSSAYDVFVYDIQTRASLKAAVHESWNAPDAPPAVPIEGLRVTFPEYTALVDRDVCEDVIRIRGPPLRPAGRVTHGPNVAYVALAEIEDKVCVMMVSKFAQAFVRHMEGNEVARENTVERMMRIQDFAAKRVGDPTARFLGTYDIRTLSSEDLVMRGVIMQNRCAQCGTSRGRGAEGTLKRCGKCLGPLYCSAECQRAHWRGQDGSNAHKKECKQCLAEPTPAILRILARALIGGMP